MNNIGQDSMGGYLLLYCLFVLLNPHLSRGQTWYKGDKIERRATREENESE